MSSTRTKLTVAAVLASVALLVVYGRALYESHDALDAARATTTDSSFNPTDQVAARAQLRHYRHAVEWYAPLNPFSRTAADTLLGLTQDESLPPGFRLEAAENLRSAILVTRSLFTPYSEHVAATEEVIADLRAREVVVRRGGDLTEERARMMALLTSSRARAPNPWWSLVTTLGFVAWIGVTARGLYARQQYVAHAVISTALLGLWLLGLTRV